jgi:hypothetical protein
MGKGRCRTFAILLLPSPPPPSYFNQEFVFELHQETKTINLLEEAIIKKHGQKKSNTSKESLLVLMHRPVKSPYLTPLFSGYKELG